MLDFLNKEFVRSFTYSNFKRDRRTFKDEVILGRVHTKHGIACATTMVCDCWKVYDDSVKQFKYVYLAGIARQHPKDRNIKYQDGVSIAKANAMVDPVFTLIYDKPACFEFIESMLEAYVSQLPIQLVKTKEEIEFDEFLANADEQIYLEYNYE